MWEKWGALTYSSPTVLGRGAYGQVYLASRNSLKFALKQLEKAHITKYDKV